MAKKTLVVMVLDETGSMGIVKSHTISGFNEYVNDLRKKKNIKMALTRFNSEDINIGKALSIKKATTLTDDNYKPAAMTPLYDAIAASVKAAESHKGPILVVIMTDGAENSSTEYTQKQVFDLIDEKKTDGWTFVFLGADQDAFIAGGHLGIPLGNTLSYNSHDTQRTISKVSARTLNYVEEGSKQVTDFFDDD